jgi:hypothetical protein
VPGGVERYLKQLESTSRPKQYDSCREVSGWITRSNKNQVARSTPREILSQIELIQVRRLGISNLTYSIPFTIITQAFSIRPQRMGLTLDFLLCLPFTLGIWSMSKGTTAISQPSARFVYMLITSIHIFSVLVGAYIAYIVQEDPLRQSDAWNQDLRPLQSSGSLSWFMPIVWSLLACCCIFTWSQIILSFFYALNEFRKHVQWIRKSNLTSEPNSKQRISVDLELQRNSSGPFVRNALQAYSTAPLPSDLEFLLLCYNSDGYAKRLLQFDLIELQVRSDRQLFELLRANYMSLNSSRFSWRFLRKLSWIKFVFFEMYKSELVDVRKEDDMPPQEMIDREEYRYAPAPPEIMPPVGYEHMMHLFDNPECADDEPLCLERFPKKMKEKLLCMRGRKEGWGLQFVEKWDWLKIWIIMFLVFGLGSLLFGVLWSRYRTGIQDGFSVAQYMIGFAAIAICGLQSILVG